MLDERLDLVRRALREPAWDELRETRVLGRVLEATRQEQLRARRRRWLGGTAAVVVAAAGIALWLGVGRETQRSSAPRVADTEHVEPPARAPAADSSVLALSDGSHAELSRGAKVVSERQSAARVVLRQEAGRVRYEVAHNPGRTFVVVAGEVEVRVLGTIFSVERGEDGVRVEVERGVVEVRDRERVVELSRGEQLLIFTQEPDGRQQAATEAQRPARQREVAGVEELMHRADEARQQGGFSDAARALNELLRYHADDPRAVSAWFTLGRVERARGRDEASARAFEACRRQSPTGSLAEDALAESAQSWAAAGRASRARAAARRYLRLYESGTHATRMRELLHDGAGTGEDRAGGER